jgi:hypothetical protein
MPSPLLQTVLDSRSLKSAQIPPAPAPMIPNLVLVGSGAAILRPCAGA